MTKLKIFTKMDGITISSLRTNARSQSKYVKPVPKGRFWGQRTMYVNSCEVHNEITPTVPVETFGLDPHDRSKIIPLGVRKYCVMCWTWVDAPLRSENGN